MTNKRVLSILILILLTLTVSYFVLSLPTTTVVRPMAGQNISGTFNFTVTTNENTRNVTMSLNRSATLIIVAVINDTVSGNLRSFSSNNATTTIADGHYNFIVNATNTTADGTSQGANAFVADIRIDNTAPTLVRTTPDNDSFFNLTVANITIKINITDNLMPIFPLCEWIIDLDNSTRGATITNLTDVLNNTIFAINRSASDFTEGKHLNTVQCKQTHDTNNTINGTTDNFTFTIDRTPPEKVELKFIDDLGEEKNEFHFGEIITLRCGRADKIAGTNRTRIFLIRPSISSEFLIAEATNTLNPSTTVTNFEHAFSETDELGDYKVRCEVIDLAGNTNKTINSTFTIIEKPPISTSAFGVPGYQAPVGKLKLSEGTTSDIGKLSEEGVSRLMETGSSIKVEVKGQPHEITVKDVSEGAVTLTIKSTPIDLTINKGETTAIDLDDDGKNDLEVTFHKMWKKAADLTFKVVTTPAIAKPPVVVEEEEKEEAGGIFGAPARATLWVTIIVIIVIIIVGYALIRGKKK